VLAHLHYYLRSFVTETELQSTTLGPQVQFNLLLMNHRMFQKLEAVVKEPQSIINISLLVCFK